MLYAKSTGGFYTPSIHGNNIPADAVEIAESEYRALLEGQSQGKRIVPDQHGNPILEMQPAPTIAEHKAAACARIDEIRDQVIASGFVFDGVRFDSDERSVRRISGAVLMCILDANHSEDWILQDNTRVTLGAEQIKALGLAAAAHERDAVFKARRLKDQIEAATTQVEVDSVSWS